ncbi:NADH-quinone oxidoreductase subunit M [bacterium HR39]|nr:NADH-quinone oxidoreductase subunit M [bacterium HR39]
MSTSAPYAVLLVPAAAALGLAFVRDPKLGARLNVAASLLTFLASLALLAGERPPPDDLLIVDDLDSTFVALTTLVGFTTSAFSASYIAHELDTGRLTPALLRFYHAMYQLMLGSMILALLADNLGLVWVGVELATLVTVVMVGLYRTEPALEAAWKYFILGSVGIALAFFGTVLTYLAAQGVLGEGLPALAWHRILGAAPRLDPALLDLAFVFVLVGYGTKVGLVPLHAWLPDAHAEGPTPISAVLSGLLLNVALHALLRFRMIVAAHPDALAPGPLMIAAGLASLSFAAFMLYRRRDIKRFFAYSSIEHMGIATFAFGVGGPVANFAGLLHMAMHSLTKSAIFMAVGHVAQACGTQKFAELGGLVRSHPRLAFALGCGMVAIAGLPPFGVFTSEFLVLGSAFATRPLFALPLAAGLLVALGALLLRMLDVLFGEAKAPAAPVRAAWWPLWLHLALVLAAGILLPDPVVQWFRRVAALLG